MTQLNLSGRNSTSKQGPSLPDDNGSSISNQTLGALGALVLFAAVIGISSCSSSNNKPAVAAAPTVQAAVPTPSSVVLAMASATPAPETKKAPAAKRRAATLSYVNREYGVGFSFPRQYSLKSGDKAEASWGYLGRVEMDFVHPGGVTLAAVELPKNSYPGTDFKSAFVNLSVNPGMTSEACTQFAFPNTKGQGDASSTEEAAPAKVKIGTIEFNKVESSMAAMMKQADARYYHAFNNGACYEFALGLGTESDGSTEGKELDRKAVFGKLEKILATVKFQPGVAPETAPVPSATDRQPDGATNTQEQSAIDHK